MRFATAVTCVALGAAALDSGPLSAQTDTSGAAGFSVYAETRVVSRYVWRGFDLSRNTAAVQPWIELALPRGFSVNAFATSALDAHRDLDEAQLGLGYRHEVVPGWELGAGYLHYLMPGTETEPGPAEDDALAPGSSGEVYGSLTRTWENGYATLTYSRGNRSGKGNSVNLWVQYDYAWGGDRWAAHPYVQMDYLDQYGAPAGFASRFAMIEFGVPVTVAVGPIQLLAAAQLSLVPSAWVRTGNREAAGSRGIALPWFSAGVVYEP